MKIIYFLIMCLKYLLIILGIIILILLAAILIMLFSPIKYKIYFKKLDNINFNIEIKWLCSILQLYIVNDIKNGFKLKIKIFGKNINMSKSKFEPKEEIKQEIKKDKPKIDKVISDINIENDLISDNRSKIEIEEDTDKTKNVNKKTLKKVRTKNNHKDSFIKKVFRFKHKKELTTDTIVFVINILKRILPEDADIRVEFGKKDPADTGSILAGVSVLYPLYYKFMTIEGNFEKECFYIELDLKGKIVIAKLIYELIRYILKDSIRQLIAFIKQLRKENINGRKTTN